MGRRVIYLGQPNTLRVTTPLTGGTGFAQRISFHNTPITSNHNT